MYCTYLYIWIWQNLLCHLQAYLMFGEDEYLAMFVKLYTSAMHGLALRLLPTAPAGALPPPPWLADADMNTGQLAQPWISSLSAFWPGLQALAVQCSSSCHCSLLLFLTILLNPFQVLLS